METLIPFTILVDTRERTPWEFKKIKGDQGEGELTVPTRSIALPSGDYTVDTLQELFVIERKSADDVYSSLLTSRNRFSTVLSRLNTYLFPFIIVEGSLGGILSHEDILYRRGQIDDREMFNRRKRVSRTILSWQFKYTRVRWWFLPTRRQAEVWAFRLMQKLFQHFG